MGESKIPIFAYVDESGNTGKNIFDQAQPNFYTAALLSKGNFDALYTERIRAVARKVGSETIHANELGLDRLETIADDLYALLESSKAHFFLCRVEKRYLLAAKMFDVLFDSGENAAVAWHNYNLRPLKIILAFKLAELIDDHTAREFWKCLLLPSEEDSRKMLPTICEALKSRLSILPDERSRQILGDGLDWIIKHPETIHIATEQKIAKQGHFPNLVAFANLLSGLQHFSKQWKKKVACIIHDQQSEFGSMLQSWHAMFSNAAPDVIEWAGESYSIQMVPGSQFMIKSDDESTGIQMADVALWLYGQALKGKDIPTRCKSILDLVLVRGWHNDFSFAGVHDSIIEKWGDVLFGPVDQEKLEAAQTLVEKAEKARLTSMAQYEADRQPPFMRTGPPLTKA
jgi:hypothetical protein